MEKSINRKKVEISDLITEFKRLIKKHSDIVNKH